MAKKSESLIDIFGKGLTGYIKSKTMQQKSQLEMQSKIALKEIENRMDPMYQIKKSMAQQYQKGMGGAGQNGLPFGGDVSKFMQTRRPTMKGGKVGLDVPGERDIYNYLTKKKEMQPKKFDADDEKMLTSLGQKLGFAVKGKKPSWGQKQKIAAMRSGLQRGKIVLGKEFGEPSIYEPKTMDEAVSAITEAGLDPNMFQEDLQRYEEVIVQDKRGKKFTIPQYQLNEAMKQGYTQVNQASPKEITLPDNITTTTQAKDYLMKQGMTSEEAVNWIRENRAGT